ncbi:MAG: hypothetical protein NVS2B14_05880 [Chamaesiphon sp.]
MKKLAWLPGIVAIVTVLQSGQAQAATFTETSDAGQNIASALSIGSGQVSGNPSSLDMISGALSGNNDLADVYKIFLTGGQTFSATTVNLTPGSPNNTNDAVANAQLGIPTSVLLSPQLFLFDSNGKGIYANSNNSGAQATLLSGKPFSPQQSGNYYLAISSPSFNPVSNGTAIFPDLSQVTTDVGPTNPSLLTGFVQTLPSGTTPATGTYTISLTGVQPVGGPGPVPVPEPSSALGLLALGALSAVYGLKHKKDKHFKWSQIRKY